MSEYRINVRLNLENPEQRKAAEHLQHLDKREFRSQNAFVVAAILATMKQRDEDPNARLLEQIRELLHEEGFAFQPVVTGAPTLQLPAELTEEQREQSSQAALDFLENF